MRNVKSKRDTLKISLLKFEEGLVRGGLEALDFDLGSLLHRLVAPPCGKDVCALGIKLPEI